jgi:uncharacterized Zn-binding protein involved in type VI secretion
MGMPGAKQDDEVVGVDTHIVMIPSPAGPVPTPVPLPFAGKLSGGLSTSVKIDGKPAAVKGSTAQNEPEHVPAGGPFQTPPSNQATVDAGSATVKLDNRPAARLGDAAKTCSDPEDAPNGVVIATATVLIG